MQIYRCLNTPAGLPVRFLTFAAETWYKTPTSEDMRTLFLFSVPMECAGKHLRFNAWPKAIHSHTRPPVFTTGHWKLLCPGCALTFALVSFSLPFVHGYVSKGERDFPFLGCGKRQPSISAFFLRAQNVWPSPIHRTTAKYPISPWANAVWQLLCTSNFL